MKKARYICLEGTEGVGKTTQTAKLVDVLKARGYSVLLTKEPGTPLVPLTMKLREMMLDQQYDESMTRIAREFISQAIRSIHLEKLIVPSFYKYDFIIQDRGFLSGYAYGTACGNGVNDIHTLADMVMIGADPTSSVFPGVTEEIYDTVVYLRGDSKKGLAKAKAAKQEYAAGDAMEARGDGFISQASHNMDYMSENFNTIAIDVDDKSIEEVHSEILKGLGLKE